MLHCVAKNTNISIYIDTFIFRVDIATSSKLFHNMFASVLYLIKEFLFNLKLNNGKVTTDI